MTAIANQPHRVTSAIADARASIASVAGVPVWSLDATQTSNALADITRAEAQLAELKARLLTHADRIEVAAQTSAASTANWYAVATQTTRPRAQSAYVSGRPAEACTPAFVRTPAAPAVGPVGRDP